jgi:hypothetical protein
MWILNRACERERVAERDVSGDFHSLTLAATR